MAEAKKTKDTTIALDSNKVSEVDNKRKFYIISEIFGVILFTFVAIAYAWFQN